MLRQSYFFFSILIILFFQLNPKVAPRMSSPLSLQHAIEIQIKVHQIIIIVEISFQYLIAK